MLARSIAVTLVSVGTSMALGAAENPPAPGFDAAGSDERAVEIADAVMERLGGRRAWDETQVVRWNFFGRRLHYWDKQTGDVRVEGVDRETGEPYLILMNLHSGEGRAWRDGEEVTDPEALEEMLDLGEAAWINDSYWMFMPYKLKDSGVTLRYVGSRPMQDGREAEVLELTFEGVGRTPENKYHVYVADDTGLVEQWDFYRHADDEEPAFQVPWHGWERYGEILLSDDRGESGHTDIAVYQEVPKTVFTDPAPVDAEALEPVGG
ncbi:MAG: hypothetical protein R3244_02665 [Thermoanaerobaculia bacterium]|nr:hypothetical protein [Thermoanaerobaculia bacterium]